MPYQSRRKERILEKRESSKAGSRALALSKKLHTMDVTFWREHDTPPETVSLPNYDYPFFVIEHYRSHLANVRMHFGAFIEYSFSPSTQWTAIVSSATLKLPERSHLYLRPPGTKILLDPSTSARKAIVLVHSRLCIDLPHYDMDLVPWKWLSSIPHPQVASRERCAVTILKDTVSLTAHKEVHSISIEGAPFLCGKYYREPLVFSALGSHLKILTCELLNIHWIQVLMSQFQRYAMHKGVIIYEMSTLPTSILQSDPHLVDDSVKDAETVLLVQPLAREGILIERSGTEDLTPSSSLRDKTINAFIHFAWCSTSIRGNFVNGLQGVDTGRCFELFNGIAHGRSSRDSSAFLANATGPRDKGWEERDVFKRKHDCTDVCKQMGLLLTQGPPN